VVGVIITLIAMLFNNQEQMVDFLYMTGLHFAACCIAIFIGSLMGTAPSKEVIANMVWTPASFQEETLSLKGSPWYLNYRYQAAILVILVTIILLAY
jgi:hypothetical protein